MTSEPTVRDREATGLPVRRRLHEGWGLQAGAGRVPDEVRGATIRATVPGSVHTDLMAAGLIPDPYLDDNERLVAWIGSTDWTYSTTFDWSPDGHDRVDLVFDGLDTVATIELNGRPLGSTVNMHRTYRFDVLPRLVAGSNSLRVIFASPVKYADRMSLELGYRPHVNFHPYNSIRKMACNFGWDWGLDVATSGIWRPVTLHSWSTARLSSVRPLATVEGTDGVVTVHLDVERRSGDDAELGFTVTVAGALPVRGLLNAGESSASVEVRVPDVELWWPHGHGEQPLSALSVELDVDGRTVDNYSTRIGFRTVTLKTEPDEFGTGFVFVVNGRPLFVKGANWIPDDAFVHRVDRDRYAARIGQAREANINLLRVWGGGIFESDDFYELCDELGIMVWQDFLFACAAYSEEEPLRSEVVAEVRDNVVRLLPHPSLVLWNGNNENIWGFHDWHWKERLEGRSWGLGYYLEMLPALLAELDPHRAYTSASPWSPSPDIHPNDPDHGSMHQWDMWNQRDYLDYRTYIPRFVGEFGWQGPPTWATLTRSISDDPLTPESPGMIGHQKALSGNDKLTDGLTPHFPFPDRIDDWHWAMSLNQAVAVRTNIEHLRSYSPRCAGSVVWQLNDCWPVTSWAAIDGDGRAKPTLYAIRHAYADRLVTVQPRGDSLVVAVVNDTAETWSGDLVIRRLTFEGKTLEEAIIQIGIDGRGASQVAIPPEISTPATASHELIVATLDGTRGTWFFVEYRDSELEEDPLEASIEATADGYSVRVTARTLARDVALLVDRVDPTAVVDEMLATLLPGETAEFRISTARHLEADELLSREVLRTANQLVFPRRGDA